MPDLVALLLDPLIAALGGASDEPVRRESGSPDHVIADPPLTRAELVDWVFEGRAHPPKTRVWPDPEGPDPDAKYRRFSFRPTPNEVQYLRKAFAQRWLDSGPGWWLESAMPDWVPAAVKTQIGALDRDHAFRRSVAPVVATFDGTPPYGRIVMWYGAGDFLSYDELWIYQEFPDDEAFYQALDGVDDHEAGLLHFVYTCFNRDLDLFVVQRKMRPDRAREELRRIWGAIFNEVIDAAMKILQMGTAISAMNRIPDAKDSTIEAAQSSFQQKRQLFALSARNKAPWTILYRGAALKRLFRDASYDLEHDLGAGTYFSTEEQVATVYRDSRAASGDASVVLRLEIKNKSDLGTVLDLVEGPWASEFEQLVAVRNAATGSTKLANEAYRQLVENLLASKGTSLSEFQAVIGKEYLNGGRQICVKDDALLLKLAEDALEIVP